MGEPTVLLDTSVPALLVRVGRYPVHAGGLDAIRSLGRLGVPVYAITEDRWTPAAVSRHLTGHFVWRDSEREEPARLVRRLVAIGRVLGRPAVPIATDDEAAALLAEHADELRGHFLLPRVDPGLPARLASKRGLFELCRRYDVPAPHTVFPRHGADLAELAGRLAFPIVAKNVDPWVRLRAPAVDGTTIVSDRAELLDRFAGSSDLSGLLLQEYIPHDAAEDWFVHSYCDGDSGSVVTFTGRKAYAWPPGRGVTADARSAPNPVLTELTGRFCKAIGYQGVNDLDWRYDSRDGRYKLLDFNPRVGAQFAFGRTQGGVDVVRALHLAMTGRAVPAADQDYTRRLVVEHIHLPALVGHRLARLPAAPAPAAGTRTHGAWCTGGATDPLPVLVMALRFLRPAVAGLGRVLVQLMAPRAGSCTVRRRLRRSILGTLVIASVLSMVHVAHPAGAAYEPATVPGPPSRVLSFAGPAGAAPDPAQWNHDIGSGWGDAELQTYTGDTANAAVDGGGNLVITARRDGPPDAERYTSARLNTRGKVSVAPGSYLESSIRAPGGTGVWSAFWLLGDDIEEVGWPGCGELDVLEVLGSDPTVALSATHQAARDDPDRDTQYGWDEPGASVDLGVPLDAVAHTYGVYFDAGQVSFYIDRREHLTVTAADALAAGRTWPFGGSFFIVLNVAVGGLEDPAATSFPRAMTVGAVSIWQGGTPF